MAPVTFKGIMSLLMVVEGNKKTVPILPREKFFEKKLDFFLVVTKKAVPLQSQLGIVLWCNGSTSDSGSACEGSNPSRTTTRSDP